MSNEKKEAQSLELQVTGLTPGALVTNAKAILEAVKVKLAGYDPANYSEENIQDAKKDKAELNAAAKQLNDKRLDLEREFMRPFEEFKSVINETCLLIKMASSKIDAVVKDVEEREKNEKRTSIEKLFAETGCQYFPLSAIFKESWLNKTTKLKDVQKEIADRIEQVKLDLAALDKIGEPGAKDFYLTTLDLHKAIAEAERIKANRERLAAIERQKSEPNAVAPVEQKVVEPEPAKQEPAGPASMAANMFELTLKFSGTMRQLEGLKKYVTDCGIAWTRLN